MESHFIYEICAVIATLVFIGIACYLIKVMKELIKSLKHINVSLSIIDTKIEPISNETIRLLENSNEIAESFQDKIAEFDPLLDSISNVGAALKDVTGSFKNQEKPFKFFHSGEKKNWQDIISDLIKLTSLGVIIWQKFKKEE